ncbi:uncharacterized protein LOC143292260 [Babylonia areolata]|uniref:uncharacterized protein LOC143292260 n=1 Tax=Babylonia areolata TaxID=304850 RepID=UPI003FD26D5C
MAGGAADSNGAIGVLLDEMSSAVTGHELTSPIAPILSGITTTMDMNNDSTAGVERQQLLEEKIANMVRRIYIPFTVAVGVPGNLLCFVTLVFTSLRSTSTCVYMAVIAVLDCVILTVALGFVIGDILGHSVFYMRNDWACGFHYFLFYFTIHFNVLLLLAMTVDRFIVVRFPLKAQRLCTPKSALKATVALGTPSTKIVKAANSNIIVMLLLVTFAFLFLTSPVVIVLLYERYYWLPSTNEERARVLLTHAFVDNLMFSNHAINFLLYCISGRRFRQEFRQLLTRLCRS